MYKQGSEETYLFEDLPLEALLAHDDHLAETETGLGPHGPLGVLAHLNNPAVKDLRDLRLGQVREHGCLHREGKLPAWWVAIEQTRSGF